MEGFTINLDDFFVTSFNLFKPNTTLARDSHKFSNESKYIILI